MTHDPDWLPPEYMSPSQVGTLMTCGEQYRLTRVVGAPERPMWAGIGGSAVHRMTEDLDRQAYGQDVEVHDWQHYWDEAFEEALTRHPEYDPSDYYRSGRASKAWPDKETPDWWAEHGPKFVQTWRTYLAASGLTLWEYPDLESGEMLPGIEVEVWAHHNDSTLRSIIDRVFVDVNGFVRIVDIKTGSHTDAWPRQLILNNLGLAQSFDTRARYAGFWKAREGGIKQWHDIHAVPDEWMWDQVTKAQRIRDQQLFVAQPGNLCTSACGVREWCVAMGGKPFDFPQDATMTQESE